VILETLQPPELQPVLKLEVEGEKQSEAATTPLNPGKPHHHPCIPVPSFAVSYLLPNDHTTTQFLLPFLELNSNLVHKSCVIVQIVATPKLMILLLSSTTANVDVYYYYYYYHPS